MALLSKTLNNCRIKSLENLMNRVDSEIEIQLFLEGLYRKYGYDFRSYSRTGIKRRILRRLFLSGLDSVSSMQHLMLHDRNFFNTVLKDFSINVTEMFRDPSFYMALRMRVLPFIKNLPFIKIWHAGCSTGEEVYSMAILMKEAGLYERARIYATDSSVEALEKAQKGIYPLDSMRHYTEGYHKAGGLASFADYYTAMYDKAIINGSLKKNILFARHDLVSNSSFGEMDIILCRNVMIYFSRDLQDRVAALFEESLNDCGFLCLGSKESIRFSCRSGAFEDFDESEKIYRKTIRLKQRSDAYENQRS